MYNFLFGRKVKKVSKKPPAKIIRMCRRLKIKCTKKVGKHRVYKSLGKLKKMIKMAKRKAMRKRKAVSKRKVMRKRKVVGKRKVMRKRRFNFGNSSFTNNGPKNYGYNQKVEQYPGILSQSSQMVNSSTNQFRPTGLNLPKESVPTYGVNRPFFTESVPTQVGPNWNFMGQPDGTMYPVGGPFVGYNSPAFGKRRRTFCKNCKYPKCKCLLKI